jgi:tetratricopeptide (TPR) repeat protein
MKTAQIIKDSKEKLIPWLEETRQLEDDDLEHAIREYREIISIFPQDERAFNRLMVLYRQLKMNKEELNVINQAIKTFSRPAAKIVKKNKTKIAAISKSISRSMGLTNKKGDQLYQPEPIGRWMKRKELLMKRMKSS